MTTKKVATKTSTQQAEYAYPEQPEGIPAIYASMSRVMGELTAIGKDSTNTTQKFKFRGVDAAYNALHPLLAKHRIFTIPRVVEGMKREERQTQRGGTITYTIIKMEYDFVSGVDGSKITAGPIIGEAADTGDKSCNKCMAVAHKYCLFQTFVIPTENVDDPDATTHEFGAVVPVATPPVVTGPPSYPPQVNQPMPVVPFQNQTAFGTSQTAVIPAEPLHIENAEGAHELGDMMINLSEMHKGSLASLADFWGKNKKLIDLLDTSWPDEYARVKEAFTAHKNALPPQENVA